MKYSLSDDTWDENEIEAAYNVIKSRYFTMGRYVKEYEKQFAEKFGSRYAVMSNSGSSANLIAVAALLYSGRLNRGDEVIVPAVSWSTTYFPLSQFGLKLRFADINLNTLNMDIQAVKKAVTPETKAIMTVNLLGNPNNFDELKNLCDNKNLILLEDNCESMGAEFKGKYAGTFGLIGTFSTYYSHHLCTIEGGMSLTDDEELKRAICDRLSIRGRTADDLVAELKLPYSRLSTLLSELEIEGKIAVERGKFVLTIFGQ